MDKVYLREPAEKLRDSASQWFKTVFNLWLTNTKIGEFRSFAAFAFQTVVYVER